MADIDDITGRIKEAAGAIGGDDHLKEEGRNDQRTADAKARVDDVADKVKDGIDDVSARLRGSS